LEYSFPISILTFPGKHTPVLCTPGQIDSIRKSLIIRSEEYMLAYVLPSSHTCLLLEPSQ